MKRNLLKLLVATLLVAGPLLTGALAEKPDQVEFDTKMGTVSFNHSVHQQSADCVSCHHSGDFTSCKSCHGVDANAPTAKAAFHGLCIDCHTAESRGPTKCMSCHVR